MTLTRDEIKDQLIAICEANPNTVNPVDYDKQCLYELVVKGSTGVRVEHCLLGQLAVNNGWPLGNLTRTYGCDDTDYKYAFASVKAYVNEWPIDPDDLEFLDIVQADADRGVEWGTLVERIERL